MGAFFSLRRTVGYMILSAVGSYAVMRFHSIYLGAYPNGDLSEIFFAIQTLLLVIQCILGLMLVGGSIFCGFSGTGILCAVKKLFLVLITAALAFFGIWIVARFGAANAASSVIQL